MGIHSVAVVGQGYVGLPLSMKIASAGFIVYGIDTNKELITNLKSGVSNIADVDSKEVLEAISKGAYIPSSSYDVLSKVDAIIICVPTPLDEHKIPDLTILDKAIESTCEYLNSNILLIIESTVAPGTVRTHILPKILSLTEFAEDQIRLCFSPERVDPSNLSWNISNTPKLVSALTNRDLEKALDFYSKFVKTLIRCESVEIAETAKLLENSFRLINISFINELSMFCEKLGIDINAVISAASTKPYGFMPFYPSIGVGGHCIPVDPVYLAEKARSINAPMQTIDLSLKINDQMPEYYLRRIESNLGDVKNKRLIIIGVAYKPNVADTRETPVEDLINKLRLKGAKVFWHDNLVNYWKGEASTPLSNMFDLAIIATPHDYLNLSELGNVPILNTRSSI